MSFYLALVRLANGENQLEAADPDVSLTPTCDDVSAAGAAHLLLPRLRVAGLQQADHLRVVGDGGAVASGSEADGDVHAGVVVLT